jgi:hypothetical protein
MTDDVRAQQSGPPSPRWWQRVVPVSLLALVVVGAALGLLDMGDEIELSTSRKPQPFLELALSRSPDKACGRKVTFEVTSHLQGSRRIPWTVTVDPAGPERATVTARGAVRLPAGGARSATARVAAPPRPYDVVVRLPDRPELLRVHCQADRR